MKSKIIIVTIASFICFSCSKNDSDESTAQSILGKWNYKETIINDVTYIYEDHEPCGKDYIEFYNENSLKSVDVFGCQPITDWTGTFSKNGNTLIIYNGQENITTEIIELTQNKLSFKFNYDNDGNGVLEQTISVFDR